MAADGPPMGHHGDIDWTLSQASHFMLSPAHTLIAMNARTSALARVLAILRWATAVKTRQRGFRATLDELENFRPVLIQWHL